MRAWMTCAVAVGFFLPSLAEAHIRLEDPAPRYLYSGQGQKTGPCGSGNASGDVTWYQPGETITVSWSETVNHPGYFRISVDQNGGDDGFVDPNDYNDLYTGPSVLLDGIPDEGGSTFSAQITLPDVECELCSLQLAQIMTDKPPWGPGGGDDIYYWCADIRISATPPTSTTGASTGSGTTGTGTSATSASGTTGSGTTGTGTGSGGEGGAGSGGDGDDGCSVAVATNRPSSLAWLGLLGAGALLMRRRRHASR